MFWPRTSWIGPGGQRLEEGREEASLQAYRLLLVMGALAIIPFGLVLRAARPDAVDPMALRAMFALAMSGLAAVSFHPNGRRAMMHGAVVIEVGLVLWFSTLSLINGADMSYLTGLYFLAVVMALVNGLSTDDFRSHLVFSLYTLAACVVVATFGTSPWAERVLFVLVTSITLLLNKIVVLARLHVTEGLRRGQAHFAEAQRVGALASWEYDGGTGVLRWSDEAFRLLGYEPGTIEPSWAAARRRLHADDVNPSGAALGRLLAGEARQRFRARVLQPDGSVRHIDTVGVPERLPNGTLRVFGVAQDMSEQVRREEQQEEQAAQLRAARDHAEEMSRLKDAFLANMSHEIRTPLTAIIGFSELLADEVPDTARDFALRIENGGRRLLETLNSVLDLARLEAGQVMLAPTAVPLAREIHEAARLHEGRATAKGVAFRIRIPHTLQVWADRVALHRVVTNLLSNAVKFTDHGLITITAETVPGDGPPQTQLIISDTGTGIDPRFLPRIFNEFEQASSGESRTHEGSGLGLAITRRLLHLMNAKIEVESQIGEGTTFAITLPTAPSPRSARRWRWGHGRATDCPIETGYRTEPEARAAAMPGVIAASKAP